VASNLKLAAIKAKTTGSHKLLFSTKTISLLAEKGFFETSLWLLRLSCSITVLHKENYQMKLPHVIP